MPVMTTPPPPVPVLAALAAKPSEQARLTAARRRFRALGTTSYTYTFTPACMSCLEGPTKVVVRGGKATLTPRRSDFDDYKTIPRLLALIQRRIDAEPFRLSVTYGSRTGVPLSFSVDEQQMAEDDVWGFTVKRFRHLDGVRGPAT